MPEIVRQGLSATWTREKANCSVCGAEFERAKGFINGRPITHQDKCDKCVREEKDKERLKELELELEKISKDVLDDWYIQSNISCYYMDKTFENFNKSIQEKAFKVVTNMNYYHDSLILLSPDVYGVGKTHLMAGIVNKIFKNGTKAVINTRFMNIKTYKSSVLFITETEMMSRIRNTYNTNSEETEEKVFKEINNMPVLIIDDVGKVKPRDNSFQQGVYFRIVDYRYNNELPVILTTNLTPEELEKHIGGATADRLREMCGKNIVVMKGESYRRKTK